MRSTGRFTLNFSVNDRMISVVCEVRHLGGFGFADKQRLSTNVSHIKIKLFQGSLRDAFVKQ